MFATGMAAQTALLFALLALALPLFGGMLAYILPRRLGAGGFVLACAAAALLTANTAFQYWQTSIALPIHEQVSWFSIQGGLQLTLGVYLDHLSTLLMAVVALLTLLVAVYSVAYLEKERTLGRYWFQLGLFVAAMQGIVLSDNLVQLFICWELVGLASFLLIGYWHGKPLAGSASTKAFMLNRIGDAALLLGIIALIFMASTTDLVLLQNVMQGTRVSGEAWQSTLVSAEGQPIVNSLPAGWLTLTGLLLFGGAVAKSAQVPLQLWLPSAMVGPTSISALIHAATMVAAGVYLVARIFPLLTPTALDVVAVLGVITALVGALAACVEYDIKRVLAFSTMSQLGFMMAGLGAWAYADSLLHLFTHAFFKTGLFLGAGVIIAQMSRYAKSIDKDLNPQDIGMMGGLFRKTPVVGVLFLIYLGALAGVPLLSGFLSKEGILMGAFSWAAVNSARLWWAYAIPVGLVLGSAITAFYCTRLALLVFFGKSRLPQGDDARTATRFPRPDGRMMLPLYALALFALAFWFGPHPFAPGKSWLHLSLMMPQTAVPFGGLGVSLFELHGQVVAGRDDVGMLVLGLSLLALLIGGGWAYFRYRKPSERLTTGDYDGLEMYLREQLFIGEVLGLVFYIPTLLLSRALMLFDRNVLDRTLMFPVKLIGSIKRHGYHQSLATQLARFDRYIIDGLANGLGQLVLSIGGGLRTIHAGRLQTLLVWTVFLLLVIALLVFIF